MTGHRPASVPARLIDDARSGSQEAFAAMYRTYEPPLRRYLDAVSPDLASEVSSATWESVAKSLGRFTGDGARFRSWLFTIARRRLVDEVRRSTRRPLAVAETPETADPAASQGGPGPDWAVRVLREIPTRQAEVVALRVIGGLDVGEVASLLGISRENVRVLCHRGLVAIRAIIEADDADVSALPGEIRSVV